MSLWGMNDGKTVAGTVTVTAANSTVVGAGTTFTNFAVNDFLHVGKNDYVITAIANATVMTVRAGETGGTLVGAASNGSYVVSEKPLYIAYGSVGLDANNVYGVSTAEMNFANTAGTESDIVPHAGWVLRTEGSGGRAGRIHYEVLVAASSITGDADDDSKLPE
tara:strand:- start:450 stop:941 length:492 start_codon:yes stop_codon:yes gene_type:complete